MDLARDRKRGVTLSRGVGGRGDTHDVLRSGGVSGGSEIAPVTRARIGSRVDANATQLRRSAGRAVPRLEVGGFALGRPGGKVPLDGVERARELAARRRGFDLEEQRRRPG